MKKLLGSALAIAVLFVPLVSLAAEFRSGDHPSVQANDQVKNDMYIAGGSVTSAGVIPGDLVAAGGNVVVTGSVGVDIAAAGGSVSILSSVGDDVRVAGGTIVIEAPVGGDVIAGGGQITIGGPGVRGDVAVGGGMLRVDAPVGGKLTVRGGSVYINAPIAGDIDIEANSVTLGSGAVISGSMIYKGSKELVQEPGATVTGVITYVPKSERMASPAALAALFTALFLGKFLALLACALVVALLLRRYSEEVVQLAVKQPLMELGRGAIFVAATPVISVLLLVTLVGIPLGVIGLLSFISALVIGWIVTPIIVGSVVYRYFSKKDLEVSWLSVLIGVVLFEILGLIPFIGWLAQMLLMLLSLGCIVALKWQKIKEWR